MKKLLVALLAGLALTTLGLQSAHSSPATFSVHMKDFAFDPGTLKIHAGDRVTFQNDDDATHNVTADAFQSGDIGSGKSWSYTFSKAGTYTYACTYHDGMKGTIIVR
jgi:plastocyanin